MSELQTQYDNELTQTTQILQLGAAIGAFAMLKKLEPALSDGTRHGSSVCAGQLQQLPTVRQELTSIIENSLGELGITATLPSSNQITIQGSLEETQNVR
ncbi:hypothetical protein ACUY0P_004126 [Vibrio parahaemolyticus]|uniref:Uncharacterized protein n=1 Tax=Vibrio harveyi TaxID=669 RepID=A0ABN4L3S7_VIBHA|nr:hypothetical protein [Vibrio harveyi]AMG00070.1 hypothetical protein AL538_20410 [Vibrio harveyi]